ncbi:metal-dependent transcriptional regulator [Roseivirga misakiensis]|uniref:Transcriptional regulator MntR n=1 Tax=Roseivirga misakiensis TaxID=1563681 RepID=A0A1E5SL58_9BACT|nr:metal-dependent transcriptional regulator [Roseivirga misakiensis]OEJ99865.1 iron (metal) dependent repressor, dtxr family protein [Roseivirga misakiensis]
MASQTAENYLKAIFYLSKKKEEVNVSELSTVLGVSKPTVNSMIKTLSNQGMVKHEKYRPLVMTKKGKTAAALIIRKHRLTEMFLVEKMGFGWEEVHEIAEQVEHISSQKLFDRMEELLAYPSVDPHGSPIPDKDGNFRQTNFRPLSHFNIGDTVIFKALEDSEQDLLLFLNNKSIELNMELRIESKEAFDQSMQVTYGKNTHTMLSQRVCDSLLVELK